MRQLFKKFFSAVPVIMLAVFAVFVSLYMPVSGLSASPSILLGFAGLVIASLIPTMILSSTILKPTYIGLIEFNKISKAIEQQLSFFSGLFLFTILLAVFVFIGVVSGWSAYTIKIDINLYWGMYNISVTPTKILNGIIVFLSSLILYRLSNFVTAIKSLFRLHRDDVEKEIKAKLASQDARLEELTGQKDPRENFGGNIGSISTKAH